jgi:competence ComEA-like helix-hairpin-helix protein
MTTDSSVRNVNAAGQERVNLQSADEASLTSVPGISAEIAKAIVASRGQNRIENLADLLDVTAVNQQNPPPPPPNPNPNQPNPDGSQPAPGASPPNSPPGATDIKGLVGAGSPAPGASRPNSPAPQPTGPKLVSEELFLDIADHVTTADGKDQPGAINVNTASIDVLACLPGIDRQLAQAIISYRKSSGFLPNIAWLLRVPGITREIFKQVAPRVTARSETFRILSEGKVTSTGARQRIQVIVRIGASDIATLSYREDL